MASIDNSYLYVTDPGASRGAPFNEEDRTLFHDFTLDAAETSRYREVLTTEDELTPNQTDKHCCYSRCTALVVGKPATVREHLPIPTPELCMPRPPAGTSMPATGDRQCAVGVKIGGALRGYVGTTDEQCCYDMRG